MVALQNKAAAHVAGAPLSFLTASTVWIAVALGGTLRLLPYNNPLTGNLLVTALVFFNALNVQIALIEILLGFHITFIKDEYTRRRSLFKGREMVALWDYATAPITVRELFEPQTWAKMWANYALIDQDYQSHESYGFFIDFGNGLSTIPACLLLTTAIVYPDMVSPLAVGRCACVYVWYRWIRKRHLICCDTDLI